MVSSSLFHVLLFATLLQFVLGLQVTPGSSCATFCLDAENGNGFDPEASSTNTSEITCRDVGYSTSDAGIKFKSCMECLQKSKKVNGTESDLKWYIYNLRYTISTCLYSIPAEPVEQEVDSPCVIEHACQPLKESLTSDKLKADTEGAWGYCTADDNAFTRDNLSPCIGCLRSSGNQIYLSNFLTALEAGCEQKPQDGKLIGLSGTVFTPKAVNITQEAEDVRTKPKGAGSSTLTTGTIVGIAVGCGLLFLGAIALFIVHWRRKKAHKARQRYEDGSQSGTPDPFLPPEVNKMSQSIRSYRNSGRKDKTPSYMTTGEYYDKLEDDMRTNRPNYAFDPRATSRNPNSALPTHQAYLPRSVSRLDFQEDARATTRNPSPLPSVHRHTKSNEPDSYALQAYLNETEDAHPSIQPPPRSHPASQELRVSTAPVPLPPPPPRPQGPKIPALSLPSIPKLRIPKKYTPPILTVQQASPVDNQPEPKIHISEPVMETGSRFHDRPLGGGVVYTNEQPQSQLTEIRAGYGEIAMNSGKSNLYGM